MTVGHKTLIPYFMILAISVSLMATDLYLPAMPVMVDYFLSSDNTIQKTISTYQFGLLLSALVYGPLSDSYGRRRILLVGYGIFMISSALLIFAQDVDQLLALRFLQGCGGGVSAAISPAIIRETFSERDSSKVIAQMSIVILLTPAAAPILGGYLTAYYGWQSCFVFIFLCVTFAYFVFLKMFPHMRTPENKPVVKTNTLLGNYLTLIKNKSFVFYVLFHSLPSCGIWCYITVMPFAYIKYMNVSTEHFGYYVFAQVGLVSMTSFYVQSAVARKESATLMNVGLRFFGLGSLSLLGGALFAPASPWIATLCVLPYMMASPFIFPTSMAKAMSFAGEAKGTASSCIAAMRQVFAVTGSLAAAILADNTLVPAAMFMTFIALLIGASLFLARKYENQKVFN